MDTASLKEIKHEINKLTPTQVVELCMRMAKFKKENKELLGYLLFEAADEQAYIRDRKKDIDTQFDAVNIHHTYFAMKSIRKILRNINKYNKYSGNKETIAELLIHFCHKLKSCGISTHKNIRLSNMYDTQVKKIHAAIKFMNEDLQYDYKKLADKL